MPRLLADRIIQLIAMPSERRAPNADIQILTNEFRHHLARFYARLKLAPPYESVEKAVRTLESAVRALPGEERARIVSDPDLRWQQFRLAFESSGLGKKHRGIIAGLVHNRSALKLPAEYDQFLSIFKSQQDRS